LEKSSGISKICKAGDPRLGEGGQKSELGMRKSEVTEWSGRRARESVSGEGARGGVEGRSVARPQGLQSLGFWCWSGALWGSVRYAKAMIMLITLRKTWGILRFFKKMGMINMIILRKRREILEVAIGLKAKMIMIKLAGGHGREGRRVEAIATRYGQVECLEGWRIAK
jgi:hypothetical protein